MAQIFPRWTNHLPLALGAVVPVLVLGVVGGVWYWGSPRYTDVGYQPVQPVPFSHRLHAGTLGLDCRYCHDTVERAAFAAVPPTATCLTCHRQVRKDAPVIAALIAGAAQGRSVRWSRVHLLPDYTFFDHRAHVAAGVGCEACHGRVDRMERVHQVEPLSMSWCLDCHRRPAGRLRPVAAVTTMGFRGRSGPDPALGRTPTPPVHCSGCHR